MVRLTELGDAATIRHVFELVLRLKQICNFDPATGASTKLERLEADLEEIAASGRKAIVFSQWVGTLQRLAGQLDAVRPAGVSRPRAARPPRRRDRAFRDDRGRHVLLMSYGAGGVGLNLQFVNYVFLFDRWWNPAVEDQAINRAHRIGVDGPVNVTRFLMLETIEERIDRILQEKRELFDMIFSGAEGRRKLGLTQEELFGLFQLKCPVRPDRPGGIEPCGGSIRNARSKVFRTQSGVLGDACEHSGADFLLIVKREDEIGPIGAGKEPDAIRPVGV